MNDNMEMLRDGKQFEPNKPKNKIDFIRHYFSASQHILSSLNYFYRKIRKKGPFCNRELPKIESLNFGPHSKPEQHL